MSEGIRTGQETTARVLLCPKCSSTQVEHTTKGILSGTPDDNRASCMACTWVGTVEDCVLHTFKHELGSDDSLIQTMVQDLRNHIAVDLSRSMSRFLLKWGFITPGVKPQILSRYIVAAAQSVMRSIIETRQQLEQEKS